MTLPAALPPGRETEAPRRAAAPPPPLRPLAGPDGTALVVEMAHDLRSPLSSVISLAETLAQGRAGPVSAEQQRQLHLIYSAALYACAAASDMVELARGDRLAQQAPGGFAVSEVLAAVRDLVQPAVQAKALWLRVEPPRIDRRLGHARPLSRVLLNLTTNALRATEQGGVTITAHERGPQRILFSVADTGPGIDRDTLRTLFQPFRKTGADPHHHFSGSGLGLAICRTLVAAMGSELRVATTPGRGTEFAFELELPPLEGGR